MATYRNVSTKFWTDSKVVDDFTPEDRYFYLYLFTNPHTNLAGCYEISTKNMADEMGYSRETIIKLIERFRTVHGIIDYSDRTKEMLLLNWSRYNWTTSEKFRKPLLQQIDKVKEKGFREYLMKLYSGDTVQYGMDTVSIPYPYRSDTTEEYTDNNINIEGDNIKAEISTGKGINIVKEWIDYKKEKGFIATTEKAAIEKVITEKIAEHGEDRVRQCVEQSIANGYKGIVWEYIGKPKKGETVGRGYSHDEYKSIEAQLLKRG